MQSKPILFNTKMVQAILEGRKTQTRRVIKPQPPDHHWRVLPSYRRDVQLLSTTDGLCAKFSDSIKIDGPRRFDDPHWMRCPFGSASDQLWVREKWRIGAWDDEGRVCVDYAAGGPRKRWLQVGDPELFERLIEQSNDDAAAVYGNQDCFSWLPGDSPCRWRPSIHMPRSLSRLSLLVKKIRVERIQQITSFDAIAEGIDADDIKMPGPRYNFAHLWDSINGNNGFEWNVNPYVWVIDFELKNG